MSTDLNDFKIIKEGEAEILMHAKNEVFYNKTQVNNRDLSIAVLRTFIEKRKLEHEAFLTRRSKSAEKVCEKNSESVSESAPNNLPVDDVKCNGEREMLNETPQEEPCSVNENIVENINGKGKRELRPPRVLEALSASGLRALRYAREVEGIGQVVALDNDKGCFNLGLDFAFDKPWKFTMVFSFGNACTGLSFTRIHICTRVTCIEELFFLFLFHLSTCVSRGSELFNCPFNFQCCIFGFVSIQKNILCKILGNVPE